MYQSILEDLKYYAEHGLGEISTYEAGQIAELLEEQHAEIAMLLDSFIDGAQQEYNSILSQNGNKSTELPKGE